MLGWRQRGVNPQRGQFLSQQSFREFVPAGETAGAIQPERRAADTVISGFCHGVDDTAGRSPELGRVARGHHLKLLNRLLRNGKSKIGTFPATNPSEKRLVVIHSININASVDSFLA